MASSEAAAIYPFDNTGLMVIASITFDPATEELALEKRRLFGAIAAVGNLR